MGGPFHDSQLWKIRSDYLDARRPPFARIRANVSSCPSSLATSAAVQPAVLALGLARRLKRSDTIRVWPSYAALHHNQGKAPSGQGPRALWHSHRTCDRACHRQCIAALNCGKRSFWEYFFGHSGSIFHSAGLGVILAILLQRYRERKTKL